MYVYILLLHILIPMYIPALSMKQSRAPSRVHGTHRRFALLLLPLTRNTGNNNHNRTLLFIYCLPHIAHRLPFTKHNRRVRRRSAVESGQPSFKHSNNYKKKSNNSRPYEPLIYSNSHIEIFNIQAHNLSTFEQPTFKNTRTVNTQNSSFRNIQTSTSSFKYLNNK